MFCCGVQARFLGNGYYRCEVCKGQLHDMVFRVGETIIPCKIEYKPTTTHTAKFFPVGSVQERIIELLNRQTAKGLQKYGHTLDDCPDDKYDWRLMAIEELVDCIQYQQKEIMRLESLVNNLTTDKAFLERMLNPKEKCSCESRNLPCYCK